MATQVTRREMAKKDKSRHKILRQCSLHGREKNAIVWFRVGSISSRLVSPRSLPHTTRSWEEDK